MLHAFVLGTGARLVGMGLPRAAWVKLNHLRTGVGRFHLSTHKWGLAPSPNCECGTSEQTAYHVVTAFFIHRAPHGARGLTVLDDETRCWLNDILPASDSGSTAVWSSKKINPRPQSCLYLTWSGCPLNDDNDNERERFVNLLDFFLISLKMNKAGKSNLVSFINGKDQFASCVSVVKYNL